jgi:hypothetical protein
MIPEFDSGNGRGIRVLPPGIHAATKEEVSNRFGGNPVRTRLLTGLMIGLSLLEQSGCRQAYLDGSFVTSKPNPNDFDVAWDARGVDPQMLDPMFWLPLFTRPPRTAQKRRFGGEFVPAHALADGRQTYVDYFQKRKEGGLKGIIAIYLGGAP